MTARHRVAFPGRMSDGWSSSVTRRPNRFRRSRSPLSPPVRPPPGWRRSTTSSWRSAAARLRTGRSRATPGCSGRSSGRRPQTRSALPTCSPTPTGSGSRGGRRRRRPSEPSRLSFLLLSLHDSDGPSHQVGAGQGPVADRCKERFAHAAALEEAPPLLGELGCRRSAFTPRSHPFVLLRWFASRGGSAVTRIVVPFSTLRLALRHATP